MQRYFFVLDNKNTQWDDPRLRLLGGPVSKLKVNILSPENKHVLSAKLNNDRLSYSIS